MANETKSMLKTVYLLLVKAFSDQTATLNCSRVGRTSTSAGSLFHCTTESGKNETFANIRPTVQDENHNDKLLALTSQNLQHLGGCRSSY